MATARERIQEQLGNALADLPVKKLKQVADFVDYLRSREEWEATQELMNDPAMCRDIEIGREQARQSEGRPWREVQRSVRG